VGRISRGRLIGMQGGPAADSKARRFFRHGRAVQLDRLQDRVVR
jgi:hypothetical protein